MESLFFNLTGPGYQSAPLLDNGNGRIERVDISNGIFFLEIDIGARPPEPFAVRSLDRLLAVAVVRRGSVRIASREQECTLTNNTITLLLSSRQEAEITVAADSRLFILFVADFILKRYLCYHPAGIIDRFYETLRGETSCKIADVQPLDALSLYLIDKITDIHSESRMPGIKCEARILEFMIHRFERLGLPEEAVDEEERRIGRTARNVLLETYTDPPGIPHLAHLCATNETKLKKAFKAVYGTTVYGYVQRLRLEKANLLLKERRLNIGQIAREVGYRHQGHFSKLFFEHFGVYPKELLKQPKK